MMSKSLFLRVMREDLRHKVWMVALSALTSVLLVLVVWLIGWSNYSGSLQGGNYTQEVRLQVISQAIDFFREYLPVAGGIQTVAGALVTGLFGFRYVFHKNMVDTYHSLPIRRSKLFTACYVDGILIWLLPFMAVLVPTAAMAGGFVRRLGGSREDVGRLFREAGITFLTLMAVYLLVYGLVLTAVMLSGNILNTLVSVAILGFGAVSVFGICYGFFVIYMDCFYDVRDWGTVYWSSPFFAALSLLYWRMRLEGGLFAKRLAVGLLLAALLGWCAWRLYRERDSELSEQGIRNRAAAAMMQILVGSAAGMGGWILLLSLTDIRIVLWGIFGAVLAAVLTFAVLNIVFEMDFKAGFTHKRLLAALLASVLIVCFAFHWDWFGYDHYLPEKERIEEAAVIDGRFANRYFAWSSEGKLLETMALQDRDSIYAFLECMTEGNPDREVNRQGSVVARVTLQGGRQYLRQYPVWSGDRDVLWPLLTSREYLEQAFCISEEMAGRCTAFTITRGGERESFKIANRADAVDAVIRAYNQDVLEDPEGAFRKEGRLLAQMELHVEEGDGGNIGITLSIYETMERTVEAMCHAGLGEWLRIPEASEIQEVSLILYNDYQPSTVREIIDMARERYGVYPEETGAGSGSDAPAAAVAELSGAQPIVPDTAEEWTVMEVKVDDQAEVEELLSLFSFAKPSRSDMVFRSGYVEISYLDAEGNFRDCYIPRGALPEKYILRFGNCS